jgi:penicillin-insensitive murein DD-endopeptidase
MSRFPPSLILAWFVSLSPGVSAANPWAEVMTPSLGSPEAIGKESAGCVKGALALPADGPGYHLMRPSRRRFYGHPMLVDFVRSFGRQLAAHRVGVMLVGDLGQPRGGPTLSMHRSHQIGLDVDIWFSLLHGAPGRAPSEEERESWVAPSMLNADKRTLDPQRWTQAQIEMLRIAVQHDQVERIFVHPLIKRELCNSVKDRRWLRKIRPWWGHDDHFHVRLRCPDHDRQCVPQDAVPEGDGCDATLAWWFSPEAEEKTRELARRGPPTMPKLPAACTALLDEPELALRQRTPARAR